MNRNAVCFFSSLSRMHQTKVAIESFYAHHSGVDCLLLLLESHDKKAEAELPDFVRVITHEECVGPMQAAKTIERFGGRLGGLTRPMIVDYALRQGYEKVLCLDGDMETYGPLPTFADLDRVTAIVTPHITSPIPDDGKNPLMDDFPFAGNYNAAYFACRNEEPVRQFVKWWLDISFEKGECDRLKFRNAEQGWLRFIGDFLPEVKIERYHGINAAYWNAHQRDIRWDGSKWMTNQGPLLNYHFSGLDFNHPEKLSTYQNRIEATGDLLRLHQEYIARCRSKLQQLL